jgi:hypothetical protein
MSARMLGDLMFNFSSLLLGPSEEPSPWRDEALALDARGGGWRTDEAGMDLWLQLEGEIRLEIESEVGL